MSQGSKVIAMPPNEPSGMVERMTAFRGSRLSSSTACPPAISRASLRATGNAPSAATSQVTAARWALRPSEAARSLAIARRQLTLGDISELTVLAAEASYRQAEINFVQAQANRYTDAAALFQALGGGWWNRSKTEAAVSRPR